MFGPMPSNQRLTAYGPAETFATSSSERPRADVRHGLTHPSFGVKTAPGAPARFPGNSRMDRLCSLWVFGLGGEGDLVTLPRMTRSLPLPLLLMLVVVNLLPAGAAEPTLASGVVFHDKNRNGLRDPGEPGLSGVRVSNQREVTRTDPKGRWTLPVSNDTTFFVIKPRGWMTPTNAHRLPQFYYVHKPQGSPSVKYGGVKPTGPLPASIDFPLHPQKEPSRFQALFFGDTQPRDLREVEYIAHDTVEELVGTSAQFGVTLGDVVFDDLSVMEPLNATIALIGVPWWNVLGNHDMNYDVSDDRDSDETWTRIYGPNYYSFDYGPVHFVALDNVIWGGATNLAGTGGYTGGMTETQLEWLKNDLDLTSPKQLVVLMMHIPLPDLTNRTDLYRLIEQRPYCISISGHTHWQEHRFIKRADGWRGPEPHHHIITVTVCGSWFTGQPDALGIPHTTMRDGAPNGYAILNFRENKVTVDFKASRQPADYQMNIMTPESVALSELGRTDVYVNVFNGSERSIVEARWNDRGPWRSLHKVLEEDPAYVAARKREPEKPSLPYRQLSAPMKSPHLWKSSLPPISTPGTHALRVRATDVHGRWHKSSRVVTLTAP